MGTLARSPLPRRLVGAAALGLLLAATSPACREEADSGVAKQPFDPPPPKPYSAAPIAEVRFDFESRVRLAPGSDNWPLTWGADGYQYASFGDGGGFGGTNSDGRVSLGVARIEGEADDYRGVNVWGGRRAEHPARFGGKSYGILDVGGTLYMWVAPGSDRQNLMRQTLHVSADRGATWTPADWSFTAEDRLTLPAFCQFGAGYAGARDEFVYVYATRLDHPMPRSLDSQREGKLDLLRVPRERLMQREAYEFFAGLGRSGEPTWSREPDRRKATLDTGGRSLAPRVSVSHNAGLKRYLLAAEVGGSREGCLALFEAREPWGPWRQIVAYRGWGGFERTFYWNFSNKWLGEDGRQFVLVFTGSGETDAWNAVRGSFVLEGDG